MLFDGITLAPGTTIANMRVEPMTSFPANPFEGQQFELSAASGSFQPGQYTYRAGAWQAVGGSGGGSVDVSNLVTKEEANAFAKASDVQSLAQSALTKTDADAAYASKTAVDSLSNSALTKTAADAAYASKNSVVSANMFILGTHIPSQPSLSTQVMKFVVPAGVTLAIGTNFGGSKAVAGIAPTNNYMFSVRKNGDQIGSITFASGSSAGSFSSSATTLAAGDILTIITSSTADATIGDIGITLAATLN